MKRFQILFDVRNNLGKMNREAAIDSLRNVLAVLGLGVLIGDFATMHLMYVLPAALLLIAVWYADYLRHDLPDNSCVEELCGSGRLARSGRAESPVPTQCDTSAVTFAENEESLHDQMNQLTRAS